MESDNDVEQPEEQQQQQQQQQQQHGCAERPKVELELELELDESIEKEDDNDDSEQETLDCYPYTFTPLLLFAQSSYFDKGYSNYNSVAQFFSTITGRHGGVNMLHNVLYERKNMLYDELLDLVTANEMLVTCCIDAHFTAFQVLHKKSRKPCLIYYDPLRANLQRVSGDGYKTVALFLLLKCNYGDSQHIQEHKDHYTGVASTATRRIIHQLWRKINTIPGVRSLGVQWKTVSLNLEKDVLVNDAANSRLMSTQQTANTCYFQVFLFAVLCKVGQITLARDGSNLIDVPGIDALEDTTIAMSRFLLTFFVAQDDSDDTIMMRPLTNSNLILDFYRYKAAPYHKTVTKYLALKNKKSIVVPDYDTQYHQIMRYFVRHKCLHTYSKFTLDGRMSSTLNTKSLQYVAGADGDAVYKLGRSNYYKYRAVNFMFGCNSNILMAMESFADFNAWRKNQLLRFHKALLLESSSSSDGGGGDRNKNIVDGLTSATKYRDYYFMPQFEVGQQELIDIHHYTFLIDHVAMAASADDVDPAILARVRAANHVLAHHVFFSTQKQNNYQKFLNTEQFQKSKKSFRYFLNAFLSIDFLSEFVGLGFAEINPKEKEINSLTQTVFYSTELMAMQANRQSYEFEKECINQMARSTLRRYSRRIDQGGGQNMAQQYKVSLKIGFGYTYSKYNTLMHFVNVAECYWNNPDLSNIQVFGKDIRVLLAISCQKIFFEDGHCYYHYGPFESPASVYRGELDLAVASSLGHVIPSVTQQKRKGMNQLVVTDRVYEFKYLKGILEGVFSRANGVRFKSDNEVLNLCLLSLMLDFGLYEQYFQLLHLPSLHSCAQANTQELQVEVANLIHECDRRNTTDSVTRGKVEELLFEVSYKFLVNKDFPVQSKTFKMIRMLNADPDYQSYVLWCKIYMSLCQINKSVEVDYYKVQCDGEYRIIIPRNFSRTTSEYLEEITTRYTFYEQDSIMVYDELPVFDLRPQQPEIHLHKVRFDSATEVQSMVKYIEINNAFQVADGREEQYLVFIADNVLIIDVPESNRMTIRINKIAVEVATIFFNEAISFIPCFKYAESEDVVLFTSRNINYMVDQGGQFCTDYYGMKHEIIECINSEEVFVDLNDEHVFKSFKLSDLLTESKTVIYFPDYLLQVPNRQHLINLLDLAIRIRNVSFFILVLFYLRRGSVALEFVEKEGNVTKISGPWKEAILYVLNRAASNPHYDEIFGRQFFDLNQHKEVPLDDFIELLCENFTKYQRFTEDNEYQIVPTVKQKTFLKRIICAEECFHFSEVGSGKTKVILPLLCQIFLSNNAEAHKFLARGGKSKDVLVILVPEHLVSDARTQVYRYCLNLNFREEYRVYDDIFALLHRTVRLGGDMKQIFVTSFNQFKKALTNDTICAKVRPHRERILVVADEVDDFLDRNKLVFNICSNKSNAFDRPTLDLFFEVSRAAYQGKNQPDLEASSNPDYWQQLLGKFRAIHTEIQDASRSINKSFGIFNEYTLRHCSTNVVHDTEGYKSLIARPYESVNRAMPGSYYSDVERTIYLTYVVLSEDIAKYNELFQGERKFISFEYWNTHFVHQLDFDDLVYGHEKLTEIVEKHPETRDGISRFLYEIILRRMEIRDKSRSVNSIDVVFNFDCIGFTGTPFLENYPTFDYIRNGRKDDIPDMIDRSFYVYSSDALPIEEFEKRFAKFQGQNSRVVANYIPSDFIRDSASEMATLELIFNREERTDAIIESKMEGGDVGAEEKVDFNAIVDLCGIFKQSSIHDVRDLIKKHFGPDRFLYVYHIDQADNSDRVLCVNSDNDVQYDEEFYKYLCQTYGAGMREKIFFFVDNRNVIGKDIPFQLVYQRHYGQPLLTKSVVLAHDVDDFSKIWQAMGRSRTMNDTVFSIYKSGMADDMIREGVGAHDIKKQELTQQLYVRNCDCKMVGNISSIYLTIVALLNLSQGSFYYCDEIVNTFIEKMERTIKEKVARHEELLASSVLGSPVPAQILLHILMDKFRKSSNELVTGEQLTVAKVEVLLRHIVQQKFEQRVPSGEVYDDFILFLSGEQQSLMEISYTKQHQKQKQKQQNKNQDSDAMGVFDKKNQLRLSFETDNYFKYTLNPSRDLTKISLNLPSTVPILSIAYELNGRQHTVNVYPTLQFLYSHHIHGTYMTPKVQGFYSASGGDPSKLYLRFFEAVKLGQAQDNTGAELNSMAVGQFAVKVMENKIRQNPHYTLAALEQGVYVIGMKDQFNIHDMQSNPLRERIQYIADDVGFILFDRTVKRSVDSVGPYSIEQYILMEVLSKQEVAQNVMEYYCNHKEALQRGLETYGESQGKGFVCWRFIMNETAKTAAIQAVDREMDASKDMSAPN